MLLLHSLLVINSFYRNECSVLRLKFHCLSIHTARARNSVAMCVIEWVCKHEQTIERMNKYTDTYVLLYVRMYVCVRVKSVYRLINECMSRMHLYAWVYVLSLSTLLIPFVRIRARSLALPPSAHKCIYTVWFGVGYFRKNSFLCLRQRIERQTWTTTNNSIVFLFTDIARYSMWWCTNGQIGYRCIDVR